MWRRFSRSTSIVGANTSRSLRNEVRSGFVASVNRGMADFETRRRPAQLGYPGGAGWLDKLQAAAHSAPAIATVTPLSNTATICSLPEFLEDNLLPAGVSTEMWAKSRKGFQARVPSPAHRGRCVSLHQACGPRRSRPLR